MALLEIDNLSVDFPARHGVLHAVDSVHHAALRGELDVEVFDF